MGAPTLYWGSASLALDQLGEYQYQRRAHRNIGRSDAGVSETVIQEVYDEITLGVEDMSSQAMRDALEVWWSHAVQGKSFGFAFDSGEKVDTTLTATAAVGATSCAVTSASGITIGKRYWLRDADGVNQDIVTVSNVVTLTVTFAPALIYAHVAGTIFRSMDYFPALEAVDDDLPIVEKPGLTWSLRHTAREVKT